MILRVRASAHAELVAHAVAGYPHEVVGLLAHVPGDETIAVAYQLVNEEPRTPGRGFFVSHHAVEAAIRTLSNTGFHVAGAYHSHIDQSALWSSKDRSHAEPGVPHIIVSVSSRSVRDLRAWRLAPDRQAIDELTIEIVD